MAITNAMGTIPDEEGDNELSSAKTKLKIQKVGNLNDDEKLSDDEKLRILKEAEKKLKEIDPVKGPPAKS